MIHLYKTIRAHFFDRRELVSVNYNPRFLNYRDFYIKGKLLFSVVKNDILRDRKEQEHHYYNSLKHGLFTKLQEIKFYSEVDVTNTRRLAISSCDCISSIQILIRDAIHLNVYFRSSDFDGALPCDLEFLSTLPGELIEHLTRFAGNPSYSEVNTKLIEKLQKMPIRLNLGFGSLHRTN